MIAAAMSLTKKMIPSRTIMQAFIIFIFAATFSMAGTLMARNLEITDNENRPNHHLSYETRAAIEELSEILKHLFPVVPGIRRPQIINNNNNNNNHNFHEQNHHYLGVARVGNDGRYVVSSKHHDGLWIKPPVLPSSSIQKSAHRSKMVNRISLRKDSMDKNRPFILADEYGSDEDIVNGLNDNKDTDRNENVMEAVIQRESSRSRHSPQQHRKSNDPIKILYDGKPIMENMDHDINISNHPISPELFFMNKQTNSINSNSNRNRINLKPKSIEDGIDNNDVDDDDDDQNGNEMQSSITSPPTTTTPIIASTTTTTSSSISNPFLTQNSIHQIHNRLSELIQKHQQRRQQLEQQRLNGLVNNKSNYRQRVVNQMEQFQTHQPSPPALKSHFSSPTLGKRGPECMRRCIMQGLLHPVQCHSLC